MNKKIIIYISYVTDARIREIKRKFISESLALYIEHLLKFFKD